MLVSAEWGLCWAKHILYPAVTCWQCKNVSLFTVLKRIAMTLIALSKGSQGMPLLAKHPVALFNYTTVCCVQCVKNTGNALGPYTYVRWERGLTSWTLNTPKDTGMQVGKFMVIASSALFETKNTLFGLVSLIMTAVTQFKRGRSEDKRPHFSKMQTETVFCNLITHWRTYMCKWVHILVTSGLYLCFWEENNPKRQIPLLDYHQESSAQFR